MTHGKPVRTAIGGLLALTAVAGFSACSSDPEKQCGIGDDSCNAVGNGGSGGGASGSGGGFLPTTGGQGGGVGAGGGGGGAVINPFESCEDFTYANEPIPVDLYIMLDRSVSMAENISGGMTSTETDTKWFGVKAALDAFVNDPATGAIRAGIQFFPQPDPNRCDVNTYAIPEVGIAQLPGNGGAIMAAINATSPQGFTPLGSALAGAVQHMKQWAAANPERAHAVVLVTDGFPTECEPRAIHEIRAIAQEAFETEPVVRTFVIGIGQGVANADNLAQGGGTRVGFHIESGDVQQQFLAAMHSIASAPLACSFDVPTDPEDPTMRYNPNKVNVGFQPAFGGELTAIPRVQFLGDCLLNGGEGWYFDNNEEPTQINICPESCERFAAGQLRIILGCDPITGEVQ